MALLVTRLRAVLLVLLSLGLTLALGFGLPEVLKLFVRFLGFSGDSASYGIVLLYFVFVLCVAMPSIPRGTLPVEGKAVLITGCDKGFGFALAKHLHSLGFTVFAGCLLKFYPDLSSILFDCIFEHNCRAGLSKFYPQGPPTGQDVRISLIKHGFYNDWNICSGTYWADGGGTCGVEYWGSRGKMLSLHSLQDKNGDGAQELQRIESDRMRVLQLNVCSEEEVTKAVEYVKQHLQNPEKGLWGVVNNAGIATFGEVEFSSIDTYKMVADVNLWGTIRITKALLPLVRKAKGRVICIASVLGRIATPARSGYCVSKFGVEAFAGCLRQEMYHRGVKVITIEPGNFIAATGIYSREGVERQGEQMWEEASDVVRADYGKTHISQQVAKMKSYVTSGIKDMSPVLDAITDALRSKHPYTRYNPSDTYMWIKLQIASFLPSAISDWIYA